LAIADVLLPARRIGGSKRSKTDGAGGSAMPPNGHCDVPHGWSEENG
jgi:hypothetical protein